MKMLLLHRFIMAAVLAAVLPVTAMASDLPPARFGVAVADSVPSRKPEAKPDKKPSEKPEIKEVPKSKRQIRPQAVDERIKIKPPVRVKPGIINKPNVIKKPPVRIKHGR